MKDVRIVFMGTPEFSVPSLKILNENFNVVLVVCQPDKPSNRGIVRFNPVKQYAIDNNIKVFQPIKIKEDYSLIKEANPDIIITCAYGQIIPDEILKLPKYGCVNIHASLLPKLRGGAPIHRAIIDGYDKSGITIMNMISKMDAGDILLQESIPILDNDNVGTLHDKLSELGSKLIMKALPEIIRNNITCIKQNKEEVTYAWNITKEDEHLNFNKTSKEIYNHIRGLNPFPGSYAILNGKRIKIYSSIIGSSVDYNSICGQIIKLYENGIGVKTQNGEIIITELQLEGKKKMSAKEFINGVVNKELLIGRIFN